MRVLKQVSLKSLIQFVLILISANLSLATTVVVPADEAMLIGARAIVRGKVLSVGAAYDEQQNRVYTYITLRVQEVLKGQITTRRIVIKELGGVSGDRATIIFGNPRYTVGERVLVYLDTWADGSLRTHQMFLGKFDIVVDPKTGQEIARRSSPDEQTEILQWKPHTGHMTHGTTTEKAELGAYLQMVRSKLAANIERSTSFEAEHYRNTPLLAEPADYSAVTSKGGIQPQFAIFNPAFRFFEPDSNQPVPYTLNPNPAPAPAPQISVAAADVIAAADAWSNVSGCALRTTYVGAMQECYTNTQTNGLHLVFNNCDGRNAVSSGCAGILAWGGIHTTVFQTITINGVSFRRIGQGFVSFNPYASCHFGNACNVREITTHEMGHALGLNHSADSTATMAAFAHFDGRCASIRPDDADGIRFIYPGSGQPGPLAVVTTSLPGGTSGTSYSQTLAASGGTPPYTWALAAGSGPLPSGLSLSGGGVISGTPTTTGTFNFTVQVADTASATAQKALSIAVGQAGTQYDSQFVSQSAPTTLSPGQSFTATVSWLNTGTQAWDGNTTGLRLLSQNPLNNVVWGGNTLLLTGFFVAPGQQLNVQFQAVAPTTPGSYNFQWQVARDAATPFGQMSTNVVVQVGSPTQTNNASFISQSVPTSMTPGQVTSATLTMRNSGTTTWTAGTYRLGSQNPQDNSTWGLNRVNLASSVAPGSDATFTFNITAPAAGTYNFQWRMLQEGVAFFGASSTNVSINVSGGGGGGTYNAAFVSQSVPAYMVPGQSYPVLVTMRNTGTNSWSASGFWLGSQNPQDNMTWGLNRVAVTGFTATNSTRSFSFNVTAPSTPGTYNFQWKMGGDSAGFFGGASTNIAVNVGFLDVSPSHHYYNQINRIATLGITVGCGNGNYCPDLVVTREQMAVFIEKALGVFNPPIPRSPRFVDVGTDRFGYAFIDDFATRGITVGCGVNTFCPDAGVTREQMVTFLERAVGRPFPPMPGFQRFLDVGPERWGYPFVESFFVNELSDGVWDVIKRDCNSDGFHFCPERIVTRAEMAALLVIAFNL
jgi:putative Ig domain-containing protein/matrixin/Ig-like domain-containing protein/S-layer family protein